MVENEDLPEGSLQNILDQETLKCESGKLLAAPFYPSSWPSARSSVLIISTDPAHNLCNAFQHRFTKSPSLVNGFTNLYAMKVDPTFDNEEVGGNKEMDSLMRLWALQKC